jgi:hypothetical protein
MASETIVGASADLGPYEHNDGDARRRLRVRMLRRDGLARDTYEFTPMPIAYAEAVAARAERDLNELLRDGARLLGVDVQAVVQAAERATRT